MHAAGCVQSALRRNCCAAGAAAQAAHSTMWAHPMHACTHARMGERGSSACTFQRESTDLAGCQPHSPAPPPTPVNLLTAEPPAMLHQGRSPCLPRCRTNDHTYIYRSFLLWQPHEPPFRTHTRNAPTHARTHVRLKQGAPPPSLCRASQVMLLANLTTTDEGSKDMLQIGRGPMEGLHM